MNPKDPSQAMLDGELRRLRARVEVLEGMNHHMQVSVREACECVKKLERMVRDLREDVRSLREQPHRVRLTADPDRVGGRSPRMPSPPIGPIPPSK